MTRLLLSLALALSLSSCDRAQDAALVLSGEKQQTDARAAIAAAAQQQQIEIGQWLEIANDRLTWSQSRLEQTPALEPERYQLAAALAEEVNACAMDRAPRRVLSGDSNLKRSVFVWVERKCARQMILKSLLAGGPESAKSLSDVAATIDPQWKVELQEPAAKTGSKK